MNTPISSSGHLPFKAAGYETHFVYGGKLGWRNLGKFLSLQGYDRLWGAEEIKEAMPELLNIEPRDLGNEWGIFDEYLYTFIEEHLRTSTKPQFFLVLTTSNHPPFEVPSSYNELPLKIEKDFLDKLTVTEHLGRKRFLGVQYGNQKIGEFISKVSSTALAKRTIIALTGDHSYWIAKGVSSEQEFKRYAVPFFIHAPEAYRPAFYDPNNFGSHEDIFPTLYHLSLSGARYIKLGDDLFAEAGTAQNSSGLFASPAGAIHHEDFWKWKSDQILEVAKPDPELSGLKRRRDALITITDLFLKEEKTRTPSASESGPRSQSSP